MSGPEVEHEPWAADSEDKASVFGAHALPTELQEHPRGSHFQKLLTLQPNSQ